MSRQKAVIGSEKRKKLSEEDEDSDYQPEDGSKASNDDGGVQEKKVTRKAREKSESIQKSNASRDEGDEDKKDESVNSEGNEGNEDAEEEEMQQEESKEAAPRKKQSSSKKYKDEDLYKMASLVLQYPSAKHSGQVFWSYMMQNFGNSMLEGRNATGLRNKWKKEAKTFTSPEELKDRLAKSLPPDTVKSIDENIASVVNSIPPIQFKGRGGNPNPLRTARMPKAAPSSPKAMGRKPKALAENEEAKKHEAKLHRGRKRKAPDPKTAFPKPTVASTFAALITSLPSALASPPIRTFAEFMDTKKAAAPLETQATRVPAKQKKAAASSTRAGINLGLIASESQVNLASLETNRRLAIAANVSYGRELALVRDLDDGTFEVKLARQLTEEEIEEAEEARPNFKEQLKNWEKLADKLISERPAAKRSLQEIISSYQENEKGATIGLKLSVLDLDLQKYLAHETLF